MKGGRGPFWGKYRGIVASNIDPEQQARLLVAVRDVLGDDRCLWADPALPLAGMQMGAHALPPVNGQVWVEFEHGDPDRPVWVGCFPGSRADLPTPALLPPAPVDNLVLQTGGQCSVQVSDLQGPSGGLVLRSKTGAFVIVNDTGIYLSNGKGASITLTGNTVVVNQGALVVQ